MLIKYCYGFRGFLENRYDLLIELFSNSYHSQMTYIHKMKIRSERKKSEVNDKQSQKSQQTAYSETIADEMNNDNESNFTVKPKMTIDDLLQDSDSDFDDDNENTKSMRSTATKASRRHKQSSLWIKETNEEPLDLNEPSAARQIYATKPLTKKEQASVKKDKRDTFRTAPDGRIIIIDDEQDKKSKNKNDDEDEEEKNDDIKDLMETLSLSQRLKSKKRKRGLDDDDYLDDNKEDTKSKQSQSRYKAGGSGIHRPLNRKKIPGENYKAKKGSGDVKLANKHDPYAYIKLDFNALNKRKRSQYKGQFENIVGAAKRGAKRGTKLGKKERKLKRLKS
ncbi:unnamed protein product [Didymodactylos carnosus]|uniref:Uncharacterized protein n=1 Tax=Didymodactylos carnosus TaxID=1234261 RepID=A0A815EV25_9BILA|nr:unnamed protein product [Didymodactylos carnosus]CAF4164481.1 unnamed protein product [Didymodactylos carnosus]